MTLIEFLRLPLEDKVKGIWFSGIEGEGEYIKSWDNNQIYKRCFYRNSDLHGECKLWHNNGQLWEHSCFKNGRYHGECKRWYNDGTLGKHFLYENGKIIKDYLK